MIGFGIAHSPEFKDGKWHLVGRCVTDIRVGSRFTEVVPLAPACPGANSALPPLEESPRPVDLKVEKIIVYGKEVAFWSKGCTALIVAAGDGKNLTDFCTLRGD